MSGKNINPIRDDYLAGLTFVAIGKKYGIDPRTAKRYALQNLPSENLEHRPFPTILDSYKAIINKWLQVGSIPSTIIHDQIAEMGCKCAYTTVNNYVQKVLRSFEKTGNFHVSSKPSDQEYQLRAYKERHKLKVQAEKKILRRNLKC